MIEYKIAVGNTVQMLEEVVVSMIDKGFRVIGGVAVSYATNKNTPEDFEYIQAMIK